MAALEVWMKAVRQLKAADHASLLYVLPNIIMDHHNAIHNLQSLQAHHTQCQQAMIEEESFNMECISAVDWEKHRMNQDINSKRHAN